MRRPRLPRPWPWRVRRASSVGADGAKLARTGHEEDLRLLRRTRLRLMGVSGVVTLLILVVLGGAIYGMVSAAVEADGRAHLRQVAGLPETESDDPYGFTVVGPRAGLIPIPVDPQGNVVPPPGLAAIPPGLPDMASLAAVTQPEDVDIRDFTAPDGTPYRVMSYFSGSQMQILCRRANSAARLKNSRSATAPVGLFG